MAYIELLHLSFILGYLAINSCVWQTWKHQGIVLTATTNRPKFGSDFEW